VLVLLFYVVSISNFNSTFTTSVSFGWLLLIPSESIDRLALFCISLAYDIALCGSLKGPGNLFVQFLTIFKYFSTVLVCFRQIVEEPTLISFKGSSTSSSL
jgi:hypothetical protein